MIVSVRNDRIVSVQNDRIVSVQNDRIVISFANAQATLSFRPSKASGEIFIIGLNVLLHACLLPERVRGLTRACP